MVEAVRARKEPSDGRTPGAERDLLQVEGGKGGATGRGKAGTGLRNEILGPLSRGGKLI